MKPIEFYNITKETLDSLAKEKGIKNLERYYELTDYAKGNFLNSLKGKAQVFAQMAFHAQNATMISGIVKFEKNFDFLKEKLFDFSPEKLLNKYHYSDNQETREDSIQKLVNALRYDEGTEKGLVWDPSKSKTENKDFIMRRYAQSLLECAAFVNEFKSRKEFLNDLKRHYKENDYRDLIDYFRSKVTKGFSVALTCDFLKEFDKEFNDLPKPDVHIKDTLCAFYGRKKSYYSTTDREYECIKEMQDLVKQINESLSSKKQITVYQLDRMIWLICSGNFFLDQKENYKSIYLNKLKG